MTRVLLVTDHYPPFIGGGHRQARLLAGSLRSRGHEVTVATVWHGGLPAVQDDGGIPVHRLRQLRTVIPGAGRDRRQRHQPPFPDPVTVFQLRRLIKRTRPDVVHSYGWMTYSAAAALLGRKIPLLVSARDYAYFCATRTLLHEGKPCTGPGLAKCLACSAQYYGRTKGSLATVGVRLGKPLLRRKLGGLHSVSTYVQEVLGRHFANGAELPRFIIPSFASDGTEFAPNPRAGGDLLRRLPAEPFILFVGALRKVKGLETLFEAYAMLDAPPPLVLIGTLERDSPQRFPDDMTIIEDLPHFQVLEAWRHALFGVFPSLWPEPYGSVIHEAMRCGKAVIGTGPSGQTDMIVDGETGLIVPAGDAKALAGAMADLIRNPVRRDAFGEAGRQRARLFTERVSVPMFEHAYETVAAGGSR